MVAKNLRSISESVNKGRTITMPFTKNGQTLVAAQLYSGWLTAPFAGATPSTAAACTNTTAGSLFQPCDFGSFTDTLHIVEMVLKSPQLNAAISVTLCDRLSHQGGLSGSTATLQNTNLPTAALTRYTNGEGVMAALEIYTQVGTGTTNPTVSYTNTTPTAGRTSKTMGTFGNTGNREAGRFFIIPLQDGDTGVTSVESVTLGGSTATAGNFGVTLFKPLAMFEPCGLQSLGDNRWNMANNLYDASMVAIESGACPFLIIRSGTTLTGVLTGHVKAVEIG